MYNSSNHIQRSNPPLPPPPPPGHRMITSDFGRTGMARHNVSAVYNINPAAYYSRLYPDLSNQACSRANSHPVGGDVRAVGLWDEAVDEPIAYPFVAQDSTVPGMDLRYINSRVSGADRLCYVPRWDVEQPPASHAAIGSSLLPGSPYMTQSAPSLRGFGGSAVLSSYAVQAGKSEDDVQTCNIGCKWND